MSFIILYIIYLRNIYSCIIGFIIHNFKHYLQSKHLISHYFIYHLIFNTLFTKELII